MSDIHFERVDERIIRQILRACVASKPDILVISGDLTQRARKREFLSAQVFLGQIERMKIPTVVIPGNHDISPIYSPLMRAANPYRKYKKYIAPFVKDAYQDEELAIIGVNTVRASRIKDGRVSLREAKLKSAWLASHPEAVTRIVVTHHPLDLPTAHLDHRVAMRAKKGLEILSEGNVDMYLSGHYHRNSVLTKSERFLSLKRHGLAVQSGTVSERVRGEPQSFNVITIDKPHVDISVYSWHEDNQDFILGKKSRYTRAEGAWKHSH
jgi:3',5'-cyclic AMP phosphodiesterase CpdA